MRQQLTDAQIAAALAKHGINRVSGCKELGVGWNGLTAYCRRYGIPYAARRKGGT